MEAKNISGDYPALENYFFQRVYEDISNLSRIPILWEEVFTNNIQIDNSTIIQIWKDTDYIGLLKSVSTESILCIHCCGVKIGVINNTVNGKTL